MSTLGIDSTRANVARVYDVLVGGRNNYAADREEAERLLEICPRLRDAVRENRTFMTRTITWAAGQGTRQYLDLGTGMPIRPAAGDAARAVIPDARIAYIDHDPFVTMHAEVLLADDEGIAVADADLTDPASVLARPEVRAVIDPAEPVCLVLGLVLGLMPVRQGCDVVAGYADLVAPGSCVVISCARCDDEVLWKELSEAYTDAGSYNHALAEITGFLGGLKLVPPGLVAAQNWRGGWHHVPAAVPGPVYVLAGVAKK